MKRKKAIIWSAVFLAAALIGFFIYRAKQPAPVEYNTVAAIRGRLNQTVSETGTIKPDKELELNFPIQGKLARILTEVGATASTSQILAELDQTDMDIKLKQAEASLNIAKAQLDKLIAGAGREERDVAEANYNSAVKDLENIKNSAQLAIDQAATDYDNLTSPYPSAMSTFRQAVEQAQSSLDNAKRTYQKAIDNKSDTLSTTLNSKLPTVSAALDSIYTIISKSNFSERSSDARTKAKTYYDIAKQSLAAANAVLKDEYDELSADLAYRKADKAVNDAVKALSSCYLGLENSVVSSNYSQTSLDADKAAISAQQTAVNASATALQAAKQGLDDANLSYDTAIAAAELSLSQAKAALSEAVTKAANALNNAKNRATEQLTAAQSKVDLTKAQLNQLTASPRAEDLSLSRAQVSQAMANVDLIKNQMANNRLPAPANGIITKINYQIGEQTGLTQAVMTMIADNNYAIEIDVSENDIAKIKLGDVAEVTLDAYGEDKKIPGVVGFIEPAETVVQGVTYYKVKINFTPGELAIKPGMTATANISTNSIDNAVIIPQRAVIDRDDAKIVRVLKNGQAVEQKVVVGITGDNGMVEILSGVLAGDEVITSIKNGK